MEDDENQLTPCITDDGYSFLYVKHNNLFCQTATLLLLRVASLLLDTSTAGPRVLSWDAVLTRSLPVCPALSDGDV